MIESEVPSNRDVDPSLRTLHLLLLLGLFQKPFLKSIHQRLSLGYLYFVDIPELAGGGPGT
jgi:hypothetical protein